MAMQLKTSLKLSQQLRMTPQLQQAIKLLQLSRLELETAVRKELDENPVLEEVQDVADEASRLEAHEAAPADVTPTTDQSDPRAQEEFEWENYVDTNYKPPQTAPGGTDEIMNYENMISSSTTLHDHLIWQMNLGGFNDE